MKLFRYNIGIKFLLATNSLILVAGAMLGPIYALYIEGVGGDLMDASIAGFIFALVAGVVVVLSGKRVDKVERKEYIVALGYCCMSLGFLLYIWTTSIWYLFAVQVLIGIGEAIYSPAFDAVFSLHLDSHHEGEEWGAWEAMNYFVGAVGALVGGLIVTTWGFEALFGIMSLFCLTSSVVCVFLGRRYLLRK